MPSLPASWMILAASKALTFSTKRPPADVQHLWLPIRGSVTFQGFTIFPDTAAHRSMQREVSTALHAERCITCDSVTLTFMDDIIHTGESPKDDEVGHAAFVTKVSDALGASARVFPTKLKTQTAETTFAANAPVNLMGALGINIPKALRAIGLELKAFREKARGAGASPRAQETAYSTR